MKNITTNTLTTVLLLAIICLVIEGILFENGTIVFALVGVFIIYFSIKQQKKTLLWIGILILFITLFSLWSLRLLILASLIYILWKMYRGNPIEINVNPLDVTDQRTYKKNKNKLFHFADAPSESYIWQDTHLQNLVGEVIIDATETILPKGASLIAVRQGFGKVQIIVPYEIPVRIYYNTLVGEATLMNHAHPRLWNESISFKDGYEENTVSEQELIITVSSFLGDLEVKRK